MSRLTTQSLRRVKKTAAWWFRIGMGILLFGLGCNAVLAQGATTLEEGSYHTSWTTRDGAPRGVTSLAQTKDGYLWIGTTLGLYRFDGSDFTPFPKDGTGSNLPSHNITALAADDIGGVWVGFDHRGISHIEKHVVTNFSLPAPYQAASVDGVFCCAQASLWVLNGNTILRLHQSHWEDFGLSHGLPRDTYFALFFDREGNIWTSSKGNVYVLHQGATHFELALRTAVFVTQFAENRDGSIWISDGWSSARPLNTKCPQPPVLLPGTAKILFDATNHLWLAHEGRGLARLADATEPCGHPSSSETFTSLNGLTSNLTHALLEDRFGDIWVGTEMGIDRFRPRSFQPYGEQGFKYYPALAEAADGAVWIQKQGRRLQHIRAGHVDEVGVPEGIGPLAADAEGGVWLLDPWKHKLEHYSRQATSPEFFPVPPQLENTAAQHMVVQSNGAVLVAFEGHDLWSFSNGEWKEIHRPQLPQETPTALGQIGGTTWVGYFDNRLASWNAPTLKIYGSADGLDVDTVLTTVSGASTIWVGGTNGVSFLKDGGFHRLQVRTPERLSGVSGIAFDNEGSMWLNTGFGAMRLRATEVSKVLQDPNHDAITVVFGSADGVIGIPAQTKPVPSLVKDGAGYLWFGTAGNLVRVNPTLLAKPHPLPNLDVQNILVNGQSIALSDSANQSLKLDGGQENRIEFDYAAVDLDHPNHIIYRYRLDGEDTGWQMSGRAKQAVYMKLHPGTYRFRLAASNGEDEWAELATPYLLEVQPAFYQTKWFFYICTAAVLLLLWLVYLLRVQYICAGIKDRIEQRSNERLRIARELHDTLLQSIHGLMLRFHYAAESLPEDDPSRPLLETALQRADAFILEGRNRVQDLRGESDNDRTLPEMLAKVVEQFRDDASATIQITEEGRPHRLRAVVQDEFYKIGSECISNAFRHAHASHINADVIYGRRFFRLRFRDDGRGISEDVVRMGHRTGHWGLPGMKERAQCLGAKLHIWTAPGKGTEIDVRLPAAAAYDRQPYRVRLRSFLQRLY